MSSGLRILAATFVVLVSYTAFAQEQAAPPAEAPPAEAPPAEAPPEGLTDIRQIQINVTIGEFGEQAVREIGNNIDYTRFVRGVEQSGSLERATTNVYDPFNSDFTVTLPVPDTNPPPDNLRPDTAGNLNDGIQAQAGAGFTYGILDADRGTFSGIMRGIETQSDLDLNSRPEVLVRNTGTATIHAGAEVPYQSIKYQNAVPILDVTWEPTGVKVVLLPTIQPDNNIVDITLTELEVTELSGIQNVRGVDLPVFTKRRQVGSVLVPNEIPAVIGGLSTRLVRKVERRVPYIGEIPILGMAFRGRQNQATTNTLFIFLTPTIVDLRSLERSRIDALDFWRDSEWRNRERIETEVEATELGL